MDATNHQAAVLFIYQPRSTIVIPLKKKKATILSLNELHRISSHYISNSIRVRKNEQVESQTYGTWAYTTRAIIITTLLTFENYQMNTA